MVKSVAYNLLKAVLWIEMISWNNLKRSWKRTWHVRWHRKILNKKITHKASKLTLHNQVKIKSKSQRRRKTLPKRKMKIKKKKMIYGELFHIDMKN